MYLFKYGRDSTKLLVFMNCLLIVAGVILTAYSMKLNSVLSEYKRILHTTMPYVVIVVTFTGMYSILVVCVGMLGILIQKKMIMYLHLGAFILITLVELSIGSILFCLKQQFLTEILHSLNNSIKQFWRNFYYQLEFNKLQSRFHCCGVNSFEDYLQTKQLIPMSCISGIKPYSIISSDGLPRPTIG
ncbi:unnamed protein product [Schistosoma turkestanicum]|nr:unnamed protein product [Schistosoma turkestanicum]